MRRRARRFLLVALVVVALAVAGTIVLVATQRPRLDDDRARTDQTWAVLREPLDARYGRLEVLNVAVRDAGGSDREVVTEIDEALVRWRELQDAGGQDTTAEVRIANVLEGLGARLGASVDASPRLAFTPPVADALAAYRGTPPPEAEVRAYDDAVETYEDTRTSLPARPIAALFDYEARPSYVPAG